MSPHGNLSGSFILYLNPVLLSTDFENIQDFNGKDVYKRQDLLGDGSLGNIKLICGFCETAAFSGGHEVAQLVCVHKLLLKIGINHPTLWEGSLLFVKHKFFL